MPGKKIGDLDVYDDVNTDKSRRDLLEISKNTGTYGSPTYAANGSRKITVEQLKETLFIKDINSYNQVTTGSPTFDKQAYNGIANAGTYTLPTSVGNYEVLAIFLEVEINVTINGLGTGVSNLVFSKQDETALLIDTTYGWLPLAVNKEVNSSAFELLANKENTTLDTSSTKYPTNNLVKTYVDNLGNTLTSGLATKLTIANNLSDLTNTTQARDNLFLGATNDVTHNSITLSNTTVSTLPFIDSAKKIISATGALLGTFFQTLTADTNPVDADTIIVNDSTASFEAKKTTLLQLWTNYLRAFVFATSLTTNRILKWDGSKLVDSDNYDDGNYFYNTKKGFRTNTTSDVDLYLETTGASATSNITLKSAGVRTIEAVNGSNVIQYQIFDDSSWMYVQSRKNLIVYAIGGTGNHNIDIRTAGNTYYTNATHTFLPNTGSQLAELNSNGLAIGASAINARAQLHLQSTGKGFLPNVLTTAQRDAVSWVAGDAGMIIYNSTTNKHQGWNGTTWNDMY